MGTRDGRDSPHGHESADLLAVGILSVTVVLSIGVLGYAGLVAPPSQGVTELSILAGCTDTNQPLENISLPTDEPATFTVRASSRGTDRTDYTLIIELRRLDTIGNDTAILSRTELDRWEPTLGAGTDFERCLTVAPPTSDGPHQLAVWLYEGEPPDTPSRSTAMRYLLITGNVTAG